VCSNGSWDGRSQFCCLAMFEGSDNEQGEVQLGCSLIQENHSFLIVYIPLFSCN